MNLTQLLTMISDGQTDRQMDGRADSQLTFFLFYILKDSFTNAVFVSLFSVFFSSVGNKLHNLSEDWKKAELHQNMDFHGTFKP